MFPHYYSQRVKHIFHFRTKHGFGVHSPYMFNLIMHVIRKQKGYRYPAYNKKLKKEHRRLLQITYRLINSFAPSEVLALGNQQKLLKEYIGIPNNITFELSHMEKCAFIWIDKSSINRQNYNFLTANLIKWTSSYEGRHAIFITDINKNAIQSKLWKLLRPYARVQIDMMWYGLLVFDEKLQAGKYTFTA